MRITIDTGEAGSLERKAEVNIAASELAAVHFHVATPELRNRTDHYLRRHPLEISLEQQASPNQPHQTAGAPPKLPIPAHLRQMREAGALPPPGPVQTTSSGSFAVEPTMLAVPISDLAANLLRPCFHRDGLGPYRLFHFQGEPIDARTYLCACFFEGAGSGRLELRRLRFNAAADRAVDLEDRDLLQEGLVWAAAVVPLVVDQRPLSAVQIAQSDYDLRQILGRDDEGPLVYAYSGWFRDWDARVEQVVTEHEREGKPFSLFYHSILALDRAGNVTIRQQEGTLPQLAEDLHREGFAAAGVLDSGGSCALYDVWMESYLNHGWYFREPRGSILVFELKSTQRLSLDRFSERSSRESPQLFPEAPLVGS